LPRGLKPPSVALDRKALNLSSLFPVIENNIHLEVKGKNKPKVTNLKEESDFLISFYYCEFGGRPMTTFVM